MRSRKSCLTLLVSSVLFGCTSKKEELSRGEGFAFFKNPESNEACMNTNLSQWELTGAFLHRMLTCASNRSRDGGETLPATQSLLAELSADKMQKLVDFALMPDPTATTHEERYPYLLALSSVLDRGLTEGQKQGLNLTTERLDQLQPFLLSLDPSRLQNQLTLWSKSGRLNDLLAELGVFVESLEKDSLSAMTREMLEGQGFGPRFHKVSLAVLQQAPLMNSLDTALSGQALGIPDAASQARMLQAWRQPQSPDAVAPLPAVTTTGASTTFASHLDQFTQTLSDAEIEKLSRFLISFWNSYRGLATEERAFISRRLSSGLEQGLDQQKNPARWLLAVAQDLSTMPASDLNGISETLGRLLEPSNDPSLDTLRAKLWSSRIMEQMLELLAKGGAVPGCSALTIPGMKDRPATDFAPTYEILRTLNTPQAACEGQVPLTAALETWSQVAVGRPCADANCLELTAKPNDADLTASYWAEPFAEPEPKLLNDLMRSVLLESKQLLQRDRFHLKNIGVANRAVDPETMDHLLELWQKAAPQSLRDVALWEKSLMQDKTLQTMLAADPIERLLSLKLERLSTLSQQFHDLIPADTREIDKTTNQRAARVFAGVYNQGPMEQALRYKLPATAEGAEDILQDATFQWPEDVKQTFAADRSLFSHFLHRFKNADSIFRNPELGSLVDGADTTMASLGSPSRYVGFDQPGQALIQPRVENRLIQPLQSVRPLGDDPTGWGLWYQQLTSSGLVSKDLPPEQTGSFQDFSNQFVQNISSDARWADLTAADEPRWSQVDPGISAEFFDVEAYSPADARILALYYLRHYHKLPLALPVETQMGILPTGGLRGYFSGAALVSNMDADFALFVKLFPDQLGASAPTLEALAAQALVANRDGSALFPATKISTVTRVGLLNGKYPELLSNANFKLLSTFNLLGLTKAAGTSYYVQPLIGLSESSCAAADGTPAPCALELKGSDAGVRQAQYQSFVASVIAQNFCPLLNTDQFGPRDVWSQRLQLKTADAATCGSLKLTEAKVSDDLRFPAWLTRRVLNDVFSMGRKARLKKGLAQIPAALRFHKLAQDELTAQERSALWLRQARGHWSALNAASQSRREYYAVQFWAAQPNLLNAAIDQWQLGIETTSWTDFLARLAQRNGDGTSLDVVHEFFSLVIETQKESAQANHSLLEMAFVLMERISARPDLLDAAGHILGNFASAENYDFAGRDLPYAMTLFTNFNWNDPGLRFSKFLGQKETLRTWVLLSEYFSPAEFGRFLNQVQKSSVELGEKSERAKLLQRFLAENVAVGTLLAGNEESLGDRWNAILMAWRHTDFGSGFLNNWESLLTTLDLPLETLDGRATHSTAKIFELWLPPLLRQGIGLLQLHQEAGASEEVSFWSKMMLNLAQTIDTEPLGARALSGFLADPRLGFVQGKLWMQALTDAKYRQPLSEALTSLSSVSEHLWREALVESSDMLSRLSKALGYMKQRMVWKEDPEHNAYRIVIDQLYSVSSDGALRDHQIEVLKLWFRDEETEPRMAGASSTLQ